MDIYEKRLKELSKMLFVKSDYWNDDLLAGSRIKNFCKRNGIKLRRYDILNKKLGVSELRILFLDEIKRKRLKIIKNLRI